MDRFIQLKTLVNSFETDAEKYYKKGNKSAGLRLRSGFNKAQKLAQDIRMEISAIKNKPS